MNDEFYEPLVLFIIATDTLIIIKLIFVVMGLFNLQLAVVLLLLQEVTSFLTTVLQRELL